MSAFSSHHHHLHFSVTNSISVPKTMSFLLQQQEKEEIINPSSSFSPIYPTTITKEAHFYDHIAHQISGSLNGNSIFNNVVKVPVACNIGSSLSEKQNSDSSSMVLEIDQAGDYNTHLEKKRKILNCKVVREGKCKETEKCDNDGMPKDVKGKKMKAARKEKRKASEEAPTPTGYVHVRARRGQATDRHSLAERVRREKISERMRLLQSLVPGCDNVTGKALLLDEIINYVQSLQNQVELLVMKLATVYPIFTDIESTTPSSEEICNLEPPLQSVLQSAPFILQQDNNPNFLSQGSENFVEETEDQRQEVANHSGLNYLCSF